MRSLIGHLMADLTSWMDNVFLWFFQSMFLKYRSNLLLKFVKFLLFYYYFILLFLLIKESSEKFLKSCCHEINKKRRNYGEMYSFFKQNVSEIRKIYTNSQIK